MVSRKRSRSASSHASTSRWRSGLTLARRANAVWTVDFKGWFRTGNGQRCEPLTVRDLFSRYGLLVRLLPDQRWRPVQVQLRRLFRAAGLPTGYGPCTDAAQLTTQCRSGFAVSAA